MKRRHSLLERQLKRHLGADAAIPDEWAPFVDAVDEAYRQSDVDRGMLERALDLSSEELLEANAVLRRDVAAREEAKLELESSLSLLQATLDSTADGILVVNSEGEAVAFNRRFGEMWGIPEELLEARDDDRMLDFVLGQLADPEEFLAKVRDLYATPEAESRDLVLFKDGRVFERYSRPRVLGDAYVGRVWSFRDITQQREAEAEVHRLAYYDELTGLANRVLLTDRLEHALQDAKRTPRSLALLFLDLDRFKSINDTLGHNIGDRLLRGVAQRLHSSCRKGETLARFGGDEFVLLIHDMRRPEDAAKVAERLLSALEEPFVLAGQSLHVSGSVGISVFPSDGEDAELLLTRADIAMYAAKEKGRGAFRFYDREMDARALEKLTLESDLRRGLDDDEFVAYYQPQVDLRTGEIVGAEALVRWTTRTGEVLPPGRFIPVAESSGLIVPLGDSVLRAACRQAAVWPLQHRSIRLAVNVSARQLERRDFTARVVSILEETGFDPTNLELELTESAIMLDPDRALETLLELQGLGIEIALDDFGTGYSTLAVLNRLPIQTLKLDRSFIRSCARDAASRTVVETVQKMGRAMGMRVIAEGVETLDELLCLRDCGCDEAQGYLFSPPIPAADFTELAQRGLDCELVRPRAIS